MHVASVYDFRCHVAAHEVGSVPLQIRLELVLLAVHELDEITLGLLIKYRLTVMRHALNVRCVIIAHCVRGVLQKLNLVLNELLNLLLLVLESNLVLGFGMEVVEVLLLCYFKILKQFHIVFEQRGRLYLLEVNVFFDF